MVVELNYIVGFNSCNKELELSNQAALNMFLDVATYHGMIAGEDITKIDTRWLLSAYHVKFLKRPKYGEMIKVRTWGRTIKGVLSCREFEIRDKEDNLICIALSRWAYINYKAKKLDRVSEETIKAYECEPNRSNFTEDKVERLIEPTDLEYVRTISIERDKLDANMHVNNVKYLCIVDDIISDELFSKQEPKEFIINYKKQILYKEQVDCYLSQNGESYTVVLKSDGALNAVLEFKI